jgi:hypothetical protein
MSFSSAAQTQQRLRLRVKSLVSTTDVILFLGGVGIALRHPSGGSVSRQFGIWGSDYPDYFAKPETIFNDLHL